MKWTTAYCRAGEAQFKREVFPGLILPVFSKCLHACDPHRLASGVNQMGREGTSRLPKALGGMGDEALSHQA